MKIFRLFLAMTTLNFSVINVLSSNTKYYHKINFIEENDSKHNLLIKFIEEFRNKNIDFQEFLNKTSYHLKNTVNHIKTEMHDYPNFNTYKTFESFKNNYWEFRKAMPLVINYNLDSDIQKEMVKSWLKSWDKMMNNLTTLVHHSQKNDADFDYITTLFTDAQKMNILLTKKLQLMDRKEIYNIKDIMKQYDIIYRDFSMRIVGNTDIFEQRLSFKIYSTYKELFILLNEIEKQFANYVQKVLINTELEIDLMFRAVSSYPHSIDSYYHNYRQLEDILNFLRIEEFNEKHPVAFSNLEHKFIGLKALFNKTEEDSLKDLLKQLRSIYSLIYDKRQDITHIGVWEDLERLVTIFKEIDQQVQKKQALFPDYNFKEINSVIEETKRMLSTIKYQGINYAKQEGAHTSFWLTDNAFINSSLKQIAGLAGNIFLEILDLVGVFKSFDIELNGYGIYFELYDACLAFAWIYGLKFCVVNLRTQDPKFLNYQI